MRPCTESMKRRADDGRTIRVSNRKGQSMQNKFVSVVSSRPTLGKIETMLQIAAALLEKFAKRQY